MGFNGTQFSNHIIIVGWEKFTKLIVEVLIDEGKKIEELFGIKQGFRCK